MPKYITIINVLQDISHTSEDFEILEDILMYCSLGYFRHFTIINILKEISKINIF